MRIASQHSIVIYIFTPQFYASAYLYFLILHFDLYFYASILCFDLYFNGIIFQLYWEFTHLINICFNKNIKRKVRHAF